MQSDVNSTLWLRGFQGCFLLLWGIHLAASRTGRILTGNTQIRGFVEGEPSLVECGKVVVREVQLGSTLPHHHHLEPCWRGLLWEKLSPGDDDESYVWSVIEGEPAFKWVGENIGGGELSKRDSEDTDGETGEKSESPWEDKANKQYEVETNI